MKRKKALALQYDSTKDNAPIVSAKGTGKTAESIIRIAEENKIPVIENPLLQSSLSNIPVGGEIPIELYEVAAQLLAFVYTLKKGE
ncbi:MAG: flagellar biosynthesis protein FlhB [Clostridiales bacterium]|nr:MAG: flagellar biosynthesis protein FlhB [Clostridiales bacterium]